MVEEITKLNHKHSSRSRSLEEKQKKRPAATFAWNDFIVAAVKQIPKNPPKQNAFSKLAYAPDAPQTETNYPSALPPRVVGNGMSQVNQTDVENKILRESKYVQEELARRVMSGGASDMTDIYDDSPDGIHRGFSSQRDWYGGRERENTRRNEAPGRFGHYRDSAFPEESAEALATSIMDTVSHTEATKPYTSVIPMKEEKVPLEYRPSSSV